MSGKLQDISSVRVKATDFNGQTWDGCPFSDLPEWVPLAVRDGLLVPHTRGSTDYAEWDVTTPTGVVNASPGDWIVRTPSGELAVNPSA